MKPVIRSASSEDLNAVQPLAEALHHLHRLQRPDLFPEFDAGSFRHQFLAALCRTDAQIFLAVSEEKQLLGYCSACFRLRTYPGLPASRILSVEELFVLPGFRREGIGSALFRHALDWGRQLGARSAELTVWGFNREAEDFYHRFGMAVRSSMLELPLDL